ncbi:MAG TPA: invasion associated locus B family protein [Magnetovibrio sp.]
MNNFRFAPRVLPALALLAGFLVAGVSHGEVLGEHGDWVASKESESGKPVCFISSGPQKSEGNYTKRGTVYAIVTHRPADKSFGVVSFQAGYTLKPDAAVSVSIDGRSPFNLFAQGEFAWTREAADDKALVAAMRAGSTMVVKGVSSRGTETTDTYSLSGITAALGAINKACGVK